MALDGCPHIEINFEHLSQEIKHWVSGISLHLSKSTSVIILTLRINSVTNLVVLQNLKDLTFHVF